MRSVAHPVRALTRPRGDRATKRSTNRRETGGAPAIGIEARKGRDPARPGLGAKHESPGPKGIATPGIHSFRLWVVPTVRRLGAIAETGR